MSQFKENLRKARGSIVFLVGITLAFGTVFGLESWNPSNTAKHTNITNKIQFVERSELPLRAQRPLSATAKKNSINACKRFCKHLQAFHYSKTSYLIKFTAR